MTDPVFDPHPGVWPHGLAGGFIVLLALTLWWLILWAAIGIFG
jgi:hypothetical protein